MSLASLQSDISAFLLRGEPAADAHVLGDRKAGPRGRLRIYATAYRLRLLEALETDYPGLRAWLGADAFRDMGLAYLDRHPSRHPSIRWFGAHLPRFLSETAPYTNKPLLADLARFEWSQSEVFDDRDSPVTDGAELATLPPEQWPGLTFHLIPARRRLRLRADIPALWQALTGEAEAPPATPAATGWLLWRANLQIRWRSLGDDEAWALEAAAHRSPFSELCEGLCRWHPPEQAPAAAVGFLKRWLEDGLVREIVTG